MTCPVAFETLVALWTGELAGDELDRVEAHLFACDRCAEASDRLGGIVGGLRELLPPIISHARRDRLATAGTRIVTTVVEPGVEAHARFAPEVDLLIHVLRVDLTNAERVDVELMSPDGTASVPYEFVPFDAARGEVLIACQRHYEHFPFPPVFRVHVTQGGVRRTAGDYRIQHAWR